MGKLLLEDLEVYKIANELGDNVWNLVEGWSWFAKETLGKQIARSADSISFNICEGYGRYYYKEKKLFYYYARGSLYEMQEGLRKALNRNLISKEAFDRHTKMAEDLSIKLNAFINSVGAT